MLEASWTACGPRQRCLLPSKTNSVFQLAAMGRHWIASRKTTFPMTKATCTAAMKYKNTVHAPRRNLCSITIALSLIAATAPAQIGMAMKPSLVDDFLCTMSIYCGGLLTAQAVGVIRRAHSVTTRNCEGLSIGQMQCLWGRT